MEVSNETRASGFSVFILLLISPFFGSGCQSKLAPLTTLALTGSTYPVFIYPDSNSVTMNPNLPVPGVVRLDQAGGYFFCPMAVNVWSFPVDIISYQPATIALTPCPTTTSFSSPCTITPTFIQSDVMTSGLTQYPKGVHVTGWINDPESPLFIPGPGNYDSAYLRAWPNYWRGRNRSMTSAFSPGSSFISKCQPIDNAPFRQFKCPAYRINQGQAGLLHKDIARTPMTRL